MAVQILGLRDYTDPKTGKLRKTEKFFNKGWRAESVPYLFDNIEEMIQDVPENERYNLYYTASICLEEAGRKLESQWIIPFDVDGIEVENYESYIPIILDCLGLDRAKTGIVMTGNGLQFIVGIKDPILDVDYFEDNRVHYKALCGKITQELYLNGLAGAADTSVWSPARLLRLPLTTNIKPDKPQRVAKLIQSQIVPIDFDITEQSDVPKIEPDEQMSVQMLRRLPPPDTKGVLQECKFIDYAKNFQEDITEPQWYAMLSIVGRLEDGHRLVHEFSGSHPQYSKADTDRKLLQALESSGPRTCSNICSMFDGCVSCPHWQKINSPITLKSATYISTRDTGFHNITIDANGQPKKGKPNYDDMLLMYGEEHPYITLEESKLVYVYNGKHWQWESTQRTHSFAEEYFDPKPNNQMCNEFLGKVTRNNIKAMEFFDTDSIINFQNGTLSLDDSKLTPHSPEHGFKYVLPFEYDPDATCPRFDQFLDEVTCGDESMQTVLLEYMGYSLSGMDAAIGQKALILEGEGSNGKSVYLDVLKHLAGKDNYATLSMGSEINKLENRYQLDGKLFNISEETPVKSMMDNSIFKALVTGGEVQARRLYHDAYSMRNKAKIIMACNELPPTEDLTHGMFRRLLIIPFSATFTKETQDKQIRKKLYAESSGIFNRVLTALATLKTNEEFSESVAIEAKLAEYKSDNNLIVKWFEDNVVKDTAAVVETDALYDSYLALMERWRLRPLGPKLFSKELYKITGKPKRIRVDGRRVWTVENYKIGTGGDF